MPPKKLSATTVLAFLVLVVVIRSFTLLPDERVNERSMFRQNLMGQQQPSPKMMFGPPNLKNRTMLFVHVGKAGGETVKWRLKVICNQRGSKRKKTRCLEQFQNGESFVSNATIGYMHCDSLRPRWSIDIATTFLVSLRDPIDRIVSWFQYMHPLNCLSERPSAACNLKKGNQTWGGLFYQTCFPDVGEFFRSVQVPLLVEDFDCSALALETIQARGPKGPTNHLFFNYQYYANRTTWRFPQKDVVVVRQEMLWDDLRRIESWLGGDPLRSFETEGPIINHGSDKFKYRAKLDPLLIPPLCCVIPNEIQIYNDLLDRAVNLEDRHKKFSIQNLLSKCKVDSITTLATQCGWLRKQGEI